MEFRSLQYFLMVAREENITKAANLLSFNTAYSFTLHYAAGGGVRRKIIYSKQS